MRRRDGSTACATRRTTAEDQVVSRSKGTRLSGVYLLAGIVAGVLRDLLVLTKKRLGLQDF